MASARSMVVPEMTYIVKTWDLRKFKTHKLETMEMKWLRSVCWVARMNKGKKKEVKRRDG